MYIENRGIKDGHREDTGGCVNVWGVWDECWGREGWIGERGSVWRGDGMREGG